MTLKTKKELAFLHELFVATDWGERFAELIDKHLKLPKEGRALYVASGTGGHVIALQERAGKKLTFISVDESEENLVLAREKAKTALKDVGEFRVERIDRLTLADARFNLVIGDGSLVHSERIPEMLPELVRVAAPRAMVALALPTFSSFGEFFSIYWEALHNLGLMDHERDVESLISVLPSVSQLEALAEQAGLENINSTTQVEEFDYESADAFLAAPLVADFLIPIWLETLPPESHQQVMDEISRIVNEETQGVPFALTVKATLLTGEKSLDN
ncbi:MAG TPA: class I SAM-dependent methyltransferase [Pyrinomonadaceae bacterium]|jgi:ubiquinone/menaquinone biosynthesis C-methylase UbiE|nr:class I SAM-dependent methyltransferase [Pyrinomonadaceae bacterium]